MSGPIVRSGPSQSYSKNWSAVFGGGSESPAPAGAKKAAAPKAKAKAAPKKKAKKKG